MTLHKGVTHCSADVLDCIGASNKSPVLLYSKSLWIRHNSRGSTKSQNERFLPVNELCGQNCFFVARPGNRDDQSSDPVTPEKDHMLGRMTSMKGLWLSVSRKPLATAFPGRGSWQGGGTESSRSVLIVKCDYMMECCWQHLLLWALQVPGSFLLTWIKLGQNCCCQRHRERSSPLRWFLWKQADI